MKKEKYNQICKLECTGNSPQKIGTGQRNKWKKIKIGAIAESKIWR